MAELEAWSGYFGWIHAPFKISKNAEEYTSWGKIHGDDAWIPTPPCGYLADWFGKLGRCSEGFNGILALSWLEISSFINAMRIEAASWEVDALKRMSDSYVYWYRKTSANHTIDPPMIPDDEDVIKTLQAANSRNMKKMIKGG